MVCGIDFYGIDCPRANLLSDSNAETGERLWHSEAVQHDLCDLNMPAPPILFDVERDGGTFPPSASRMISGRQPDHLPRANPTTYPGKDGKQYVAVAAGATLLTCTLP